MRLLNLADRLRTDPATGESLSALRVSSATYDALFERFYDDDREDYDITKISCFVDEAILYQLHHEGELHRCLDVIATAEREWQTMKSTLDRAQAGSTELLVRARLAEKKLATVYNELTQLRQEMAKNTLGPLQIERILDHIIASKEHVHDG